MPRGRTGWALTASGQPTIFTTNTTITYYHTESPEKIFIDGYEPDGQTDLAIEKLDEAAENDTPFAMVLSLGTPHDPWGPDNVPPEYCALFEDVDFPLPPNYRPENDPHADAWAMLDAGPAGRAGRVDARLLRHDGQPGLESGPAAGRRRRVGLREETIFVFTSDHGEMFGAQGRRAKNIFYEEAVRVPFLLRWPGHVAAGSTAMPVSTRRTSCRRCCR